VSQLQNSAECEEIRLEKVGESTHKARMEEISILYRTFTHAKTRAECLDTTMKLYNIGLPIPETYSSLPDGALRKQIVLAYCKRIREIEQEAVSEEMDKIRMGYVKDEINNDWEIIRMNWVEIIGTRDKTRSHYFWLWGALRHFEKIDKIERTIKGNFWRVI